MQQEEYDEFMVFINDHLGINRGLYFSEIWEGNQLKTIMKPENLD